MAGIRLQEKVCLADYTTFRTGGEARFFIDAQSKEDLHAALRFVKSNGLPFLILGGGSNVLFSDNSFEGLVIRVSLKGIEETVSGEDVLLRVAAGEVWDEVVEYAINHNFFGIENLSLIPGFAGAAPIQNIGAYGVEAESVIDCVETIEASTGKTVYFSNQQCKFHYRDSIFKQLGPRHIITSVMLRLKKRGEVSLAYLELAKYFEERPYIEHSLTSMREAVCSLRRKKLPDVRFLGTAGSFFKHPFVSRATYEGLVELYGKVPGFLANDGLYKIPAGWLIEHVARLKGIREGAAGVYENHALVLVNYGGAKTANILSLAEKIRKEVKSRTNILLEFEVNVH